MRISKVRKMYSLDFDKMIRDNYGEGFLKDYKKTYYYQKISILISDKDIYIRDYERSKAKLRITFPLFLLTILIINICMAVFWLFSGSSTMQSKWKITKLIIKWDKYCNFNIV